MGPLRISEDTEGGGGGGPSLANDQAIFLHRLLAPLLVLLVPSLVGGGIEGLQILGTMNEIFPVELGEGSRGGERPMRRQEERQKEQQPPHL